MVTRKNKPAQPEQRSAKCYDPVWSFDEYENVFYCRRCGQKMTIEKMSEISTSFFSIFEKIGK